MLLLFFSSCSFLLLWLRYCNRCSCDISHVPIIISQGMKAHIHDGNQHNQSSRERDCWIYELIMVLSNALANAYNELQFPKVHFF